MTQAIAVNHLTKDYGANRGVFDMTFDISKGEMFGFVGANGAGKTTTIRNIMGFLKPDSGNVQVYGMDSWSDAARIKKYIGYVPGEIAFPDLRTGTEFLKSQAEFYGIRDMTYANQLIERLQLDPSANLKRMSKGMKQKTALVEALMKDPEIIILDEPTTGLDPLMRVEFMEIIRQEKEKGKTIFMSSHMLEEVETSCDRVGLISHGRIVAIADLHDITNRSCVEYKVEFCNQLDYDAFLRKNYTVVRNQEQYNQVTIAIPKAEIAGLFQDLKDTQVKFISEVKITLENYFAKIMKEKEKENDQQAVI